MPLAKLWFQEQVKGYASSEFMVRRVALHHKLNINLRRVGRAECLFQDGLGSVEVAPPIF